MKQIVLYWTFPKSFCYLLFAFGEQSSPPIRPFKRKGFSILELVFSFFFLYSYNIRRYPNILLYHDKSSISSFTLMDHA